MPDPTTTETTATARCGSSYGPDAALRIDRVYTEWRDDDSLDDDGEPYQGCVATAEVSYPISAQGDRRIEWLTSGGLWGIEPHPLHAYRSEVELEQLDDLRDHLRHFGFHPTDEEWERLCVRA